MKQYLYISIICFAISLIGIMLMSCASVPQKAVSYQLDCAGDAALIVIAVGQDYPTRGRAGTVESRGHVQTEYKRDGKWIPLKIISRLEIVESGEDFEMPDIEYMTGREVLLEYLIRLKE